MKVVTDPKEYSELVRKPYALFEYKMDRMYRVESTPVGLFVAAKNNSGDGWFQYRLPKMPAGILKAIMRFFRHIAEDLHTEVLVRVYFDPISNSYLLEVPKQEVTAHSVETKDALLEGIYPVMDIHSHCEYSAFFSYIDDRDEAGNRLYGVIGDNLERPQFRLRAGTGGCFVELEKPYDVFDMDDIDGEEWFDYLSDRMCQIRKL